MMRSAPRGRAGEFAAGSVWVAAGVVGAEEGAVLARFAGPAWGVGSADRYGSPICGERAGTAAPPPGTPRLWGTPGRRFGVDGGCGAGAVAGVLTGDALAAGGTVVAAESVELPSGSAVDPGVPASGSAYSPYCGLGRSSCADVTRRSPTFRRCRAAVLPRQFARPLRSQLRGRRREGRTASCCRPHRRSSARRRSS